MLRVVASRSLPIRLTPSYLKGSSLYRTAIPYSIDQRRSHISPRLQLVLDRGIYENDGSAYTREDKDLHNRIKELVDIQDIRGVFREISRTRSEGKDVTNATYTHLLRCVQYMCTFDPNALEYIDIIIKQMIKDNIQLNEKIIYSLIRAYTGSM